MTSDEPPKENTKIEKAKRQTLFQLTVLKIETTLTLYTNFKEICRRI
jgi:hypothetical protein